MPDLFAQRGRKIAVQQPAEESLLIVDGVGPDRAALYLLREIAPEDFP